MNSKEHKLFVRYYQTGKHPNLPVIKRKIIPQPEIEVNFLLLVDTTLLSFHLEGGDEVAG